MTSGIKLGLMSRFSLLALGTLILGLLLAGVQLGAASTQPDSKTNWRFGVIESYEDPQAARQLGVSWTRVPFNWADLQAEGPDTWTPKVSQEKIDQEMVAGQMVVGLLIGIPEWARDQQDLPKGLWLDADNPGNTWATFVRQAVSRHRGRIDHWIIWNEPDIAESEIAHTWHGSVADFAQLQRTAYRAAKEGNPSAVIHLPLPIGPITMPALNNTWLACWTRSWPIPRLPNTTTISTWPRRICTFNPARSTT